MIDLTIIKQNGGAYIDSREVADIVEKTHKNLLRDIRGYVRIMDNFGRLKIEPSDFFVESSYYNAQNKEMPCFLLSKMGCEMVANKLTGEKGVMFTAAYVTTFNEMEQKERAEFEAKAATPMLRVFNTAVKNVLCGYSNTYGSANEVMKFLDGAYKPFGIEISYEDNERHYLTATDIAQSIGIYSDTGRPHGHAVAKIIENLYIAPEHISIVPYGLVGISMRYDFYVLQAVEKWIEDNNFPCDIPHLDFEYHIYYNRQLSLFDDDEYGYDSFGFDDED